MSSWSRKARRANQHNNARRNAHHINQEVTEEYLTVYPENNPGVAMARYYLDGSREVFFTKEATAKMDGYVESSARAFEAKFGRPMRDDDPLFWDPTADEPRPMQVDYVIEQVVEAMHKAGIHPAHIYAYNKTGILLTKEIYELTPSDDLAEYEAALQEYLELP
jgi:hypothetical protein